MNSEFQRCIDDHKLKPFKATKQMIEKEIASAGYDLKRAQESLNEGDAKWSTVQSYYAIFHSARALLFNRGYRERSHRCLLIALQELYVRTGELPPEYNILIFLDWQWTCARMQTMVLFMIKNLPMIFFRMRKNSITMF